MRKLTLDEMNEVAGGRQFDSTDWGWDEMSTGDYEWAMLNFKHDVWAGMKASVEGATSSQDANQKAQTYLDSKGLSGAFQINVQDQNTPGEEAIVVTGDPLRFVQSGLYYMPQLTFHNHLFSGLDIGAQYDPIDRASIDINVWPGIDQNDPVNAAALETFAQTIRDTIFMLNVLPSNVFQTIYGIISVNELRDKLARADFIITPFDYNSDQFSRGGAANFNGGDPILETSMINLRGYMQSPTMALWYVLHEIAHVTNVGQALHNNLWANGPPSQQAFSDYERFTNDLAKAIAAEGGFYFNYYFAPPHGFSSNPGITFVPPSSGGGSGGGGGGGGGWNNPEP